MNAQRENCSSPPVPKPAGALPFARPESCPCSPNSPYKRSPNCSLARKSWWSSERSKTADWVAFKSQQPRLYYQPQLPAPQPTLPSWCLLSRRPIAPTQPSFPKANTPYTAKSRGWELTGTSCLSSAPPPPTGGLTAADMSRVKTGGTEKSLSSWAACRALNHWPVLCTPPGWGHLQPAVTTFYFLSISQLKILRSTEPSRDA